MIKEWSVSNFKSIKGNAEIKLSPLTILAGNNSSGKSTLIQSILLVSQTLASKIDDRPIVLNGALTELGQFDDIKSSGSPSDCISVSFRCEPRSEQGISQVKKMALTSKGPIYYGPNNTGIGSISCEFCFDSAQNSVGDDKSQINNLSRQPRLLTSRLKCSKQNNSAKQSEIFINYHANGADQANNAETDQQLREGLRYTVALDEHSNIEIKSEYMSAHAKGCLLRHFLPRRIIYEINQTLENANAITQALQYGLPQNNNAHARVLPEPFLTRETLLRLGEILRDTVNLEELFANKTLKKERSDASDKISLREWYEALLKLPSDVRIRMQTLLREDDELFSRIYDSLKNEKTSDRTMYVLDRPPEQITVASWYLHDYFSSFIRYLAPLRTSPKSLYPQKPLIDPIDIGIRGDNTASILELHKDREINYVPSAVFHQAEVDTGTVKATLVEAVVDWLGYLGIANNIQTQDLGKVGHSLQVVIDESSQSLDLTNVGIGVSQILPVLVLGLLSENDVTIVLEQPELHLHPKIQTLLADFLLSLVLADKQCIVETHSEYIVDRIRYRIAASQTGSKLADMASLYFVEKSAQGSSFREIKINDYGAIEDWPEGFFDQSYRLAAEILSAARKKRMSEGASNE